MSHLGQSNWILILGIIYMRKFRSIYRKQNIFFCKYIFFYQSKYAPYGIEMNHRTASPVVIFQRPSWRTQYSTLSKKKFQRLLHCHFFSAIFHIHSYCFSVIDRVSSVSTIPFKSSLLTFVYGRPRDKFFEIKISMRSIQLIIVVH